MLSESLLNEMEALVALAEGEAREFSAEESERFETLKADHAAALAAEAESAAAVAQAASDRRAVIEASRTAAQAAREQAVNASHRPVRAAGPEVPREFSTIGEFLGAAARAATGYDRSGDPRLTSLHTSVLGEQRMSVGADGGFLVPDQFRAEVFRVMGQESIVRPRATVLPAGDPPDGDLTIPALDQTGAAPDSVYGGVTMSWIAEGALKPETDANFREITLRPQELGGHVVVTDKIMRNSAALGAMLASLLPSALAAYEDRAFTSGDGVGKPLGYINSGAAYTHTRDANSSVSYSDAVQMLSRMLVGDGEPVWIANKSLLPILMQIQDNSGGSPGVGSYVWQQSLVPGQPSTFLGYPVIWSQRAPALGSKGDLSLVDLKYYLVKEGSGPIIAASEHAYFTRNKTAIKIFSNVDGQPWLTAPFSGEDGRQYSPFVVLSANA